MCAIYCCYIDFNILYSVFFTAFEVIALYFVSSTEFSVCFLSLCMLNDLLSLRSKIFEAANSEISCSHGEESEDYNLLVVNTPASHLGGPGFNSQPRRTVIQIEVLRGFLSSSRPIPG
jgi:hypothetical protein